MLFHARDMLSLVLHAFFKVFSFMKINCLHKKEKMQAKKD